MVYLIYNNNKEEFPDSIFKISTYFESLKNENEPIPFLNATEELIDIFRDWFYIMINNFNIEIATPIIYNVEFFKDYSNKKLIEIFNFAMSNHFEIICNTVAFEFASRNPLIHEYENNFYIIDKLISIKNEISQFETLHLNITLTMLILKFMSIENYLKQPAKVKKLITYKELNIKDSYNNDNTFDTANEYFFDMFSHEELLFWYNVWKNENYNNEYFFKLICLSDYNGDLTELLGEKHIISHRLNIESINNLLNHVDCYKIMDGKIIYENQIYNTLPDSLCVEFPGEITLKIFLDMILIFKNIVERINMKHIFKEFHNACANSEKNSETKYNRLKNSNLKEFIIPAEVECITEKEFANCYNLTNIVTHSNIKEISRAAFYECRSLKNISLPEEITIIPDNCFMSCTSLTHISIPSSVTFIENGAFDNCSSLKTIDMPNKLTSIEPFSFYNCYELTGITLPDGLKILQNCSFKNCHNLVNINIPTSVTKIQMSSFSGCKKLNLSYMDTLYHVSSSTENFVIHSNIKNIAADCFKDCFKLSSINIPTNVTYIGENFSSNLLTITIPSSIHEITQNCFKNCYRLKTVVLPNTISVIKYSAFYNCYDLTSINIPNGVTSISMCAFENCTSLKNIELPNSLIKISEKAFFNCSSLKNVIIPTSVTEIENGAFDNTD